MSFQIAGLGTAVPEHVIEQAHSAAISAPLCCESPEQKRLLGVLYRRTGVRTRRSVLLESSDDDQVATQSFYHAPNGTNGGPTTARRMERYTHHAPLLAMEAAEAALRSASISPDQVTHLITISCTGFHAPGVDFSLIRDLPLLPGVARTHIGFMGCHGVLNGLRVARAFAESDPAACVLMCAVELCSLHQQYGWRPDQIVANALFSDGAAAIVGRRAEEGSAQPWQVAATGSAVLPDSTDMMGWRVGDHGFEMSLSPRVPDLIHTHLRPWLEQWLAEQDLTITDVGSWAVHPGGPRILQACTEAAGLGPDALADSFDVLADYGNMSSPTVLFILDRLRQRDAPRPCVMLAFGPGLTIEAALIR